MIGLGLSLLLAFQFNLKLIGIWGGWLTGASILFVYEVRFLLKVQWSDLFDKVRTKYRVIEDNIRESRIEISAYKQF